MTKRKAKRKKGRIRKKHNASNFMPAIQAKPTLNEDNIDKLPKIMINCRAKLDDRDINNLKSRLNFANHNDLRKLNGIRVVDPDTIKMPSRESTTGCYYPGKKTGKAEIWISSDLIKPPKGFEAFLNRIAYKDKLFKTLFHEIGHHKARLMHSVDKFENEAYAEKYMHAYRKLWNKHYGPAKIYIAVFKIFIYLIRFIFVVVLYPFRNRNKDLNLFYRNLKGEITFREYVEGITKSTNGEENRTGKGKKKWTHPLTRKKYLDRFRLPER